MLTLTLIRQYLKTHDLRRLHLYVLTRIIQSVVTMRYEITGDNLQIVTLHLDGNEIVYAEAGAMNHMSPNMQMEAKMKGGLFSGIKRKISGESLFLTEFTPAGSSGYVAFAGNVPGRIRPIELHGTEFLAQKDAFLCAESGVHLDIAFTKKLGAGFFGGEGFILEKFSGDGTVFIHACGDFIEMDLSEGESVKVSGSHHHAIDDDSESRIRAAGIPASRQNIRFDIERNWRASRGLKLEGLP
jgi:uncharacterized protein (TIGR00266 family)